VQRPRDSAGVKHHQEAVMKPEQAAGIRDFFVESLKMEAKTTRRVIEAVPDAKSSYRPDEKSRTGFELAWHIASTDAWFLAGCMAGNFDTGSDSSDAVPPEIKKVADILSFYDQNYISQIEKLKQLSGEQCAKVVNFFGAFDFPIAVYISWIEKHQVHHRGQLSAYLRAMGGKVPNIYGGSADEPMQMAAQS
jgi:uncharacterized damage-inducible protein DinB